MSKREEITNQIKEAVNEFRLNEVYGGETGYSTDKKYRYILICRARNLDGEIRVYSPTYITVGFTTRYKNCDHKMYMILKSSEDVIAFLKHSFVDYKDANEYLSGIVK